MPSYDYRCEACGRAVTLFYKTYRDYDAATHTCPHCGSTQLTRLIRRVTLGKTAEHNYASMSSGEMLSVLEGGDSREVGQLFQQVGAGVPAADQEYHEVTDRLLKGDKPQTIEADLREKSNQAIKQERQQTTGD
jgi:putative FmdB family regulatory protein